MSASCLDPIEPTQVSSVVAINPASSSVVTLPQATIMNAAFSITNFGDRSLQIDLKYRRLEKLVDQRWRLADEQGAASGGGVVILDPGQVTAATYAFGYDPNSSGTNPLLVQPRGVYRMRFRIFLPGSVTEVLPRDQSYSRPFSVDCC